MKKTLWLLLVLFIALPALALKPKAKHVVLIAFDGWGAHTLRGDTAAQLPNIRSLMDAGCYTLHKRSVMPSSSAINWASMFMGAPTEVHGYNKWNSQAPDPNVPSYVTGRHGVFPTIFTLMEEQRPADETGCIYEWDGIKHVIDVEAVGHDFHTYDKLDSTACYRTACQYIREQRPTLLAVCFNQVDAVGHSRGFDSPELYAKLRQLDVYVGHILRALKDADMWDDTIILMTADHGGHDRGHGTFRLLDLETPFIIAGHGIRRGGEFRQLMMQYDTAATMAYALGLTPPQAWVGRPATWVFK